MGFFGKIQTTKDWELRPFGKILDKTTVHGVEPGQTSLHPGFQGGSSPFDDAAVIRFIAPVAGKYVVKAQFFAGDTGETEGWIVANSNLEQPLAHFASTDSDPEWRGTVALAFGETLDMVVGHSTDGYFSDNTPVALTIKKK